jgi:3-methyladenine DNA glycosylase AlkD
MKSEMPYRGLTSAALKATLRPILADPAYRIGERSEWDATVRELWDAATHREERYAATALTGHRAYRAWQDPDAVPLYQHMITTGAWWDHVDELASNRVGPILLQHSEVMTPLMRDWALDDDRWLRRSAIIGQLTFKDQTDTELLVDVIEPNLPEKAFWIRKAIGWALRQYARTDPAWVRQTVDDYGDRMSGLSRREALKHLL